MTKRRKHRATVRLLIATQRKTMTKKQWREQQRKLPFEQKLRILEELRLRDLEIRNSSLARSRQRPPNETAQTPPFPMSDLSPAPRSPFPRLSLGLNSPLADVCYNEVYAQLFGCEPFSPSSARPSSRNHPSPLSVMASCVKCVLTGPGCRAPGSCRALPSRRGVCGTKSNQRVVKRSPEFPCIEN